MSRNKLYILLFSACIVGYGWIIWIHAVRLSHSVEPEVCLIRYLAGIPCPSCGSSRSVLAILDGNIRQAFYFNPLGFMIALILVVSPAWIIYDAITSGDSLLKVYTAIESMFRRKAVAISAIVLVLLNWIWNLYKY